MQEEASYKDAILAYQRSEFILLISLNALNFVQGARFVVHVRRLQHRAHLLTVAPLILMPWRVLALFWDVMGTALYIVAATRLIRQSPVRSQGSAACYDHSVRCWHRGQALVDSVCYMCPKWLLPIFCLPCWLLHAHSNST